MQIWQYIEQWKNTKRNIRIHEDLIIKITYQISGEWVVLR